MLRELKQGVLFTAVTIILIGGVYNVVIWAIARSVFASRRA